jgi:hypothetical protein
MSESKIIGFAFSSVGVTEILSLADIKEHLYIDSANTSFDTRLNALNTEVRQYIEEITGKSLIDKTVEVLIKYCAPFGIPFGPVVTFDTAYIKTGINEFETQTGNDEYEIQYNKFESYVGGDVWKLIYDAGYTDDTLPAGLKLAWLNEIAKRFEHRGEEVELLSLTHVNDILNSYKDLEWLV